MRGVQPQPVRAPPAAVVRRRRAGCGFAAALAAAQHDPARPFATFALALAALPGAHWSALSPRRRAALLAPGGARRAASLAQAPLRVDERILHYLTGIAHIDERLQGLSAPARAALRGPALAA